MKLKILIHPADEGGFWVEIPALRGCVSQGETLEEALLNIQEAAVGWLEVATELALRGTTAQVAEIQL
ncbi:MAG: HicB family protein [Thiotrichaceae bacterium IS1]|jgi:predicted RNase H-like HicB family nuclease|nr:MAG: HicB family protein [Thiotrichaceae bacterium IS1]